MIITLLTIYNNTAEDLQWFYKNKGNKGKIRPLKDLIPVRKIKYIITVFKLLPTPPNTPLKYLFTAVLIMAILKKALKKNTLNI